MKRANIDGIGSIVDTNVRLAVEHFAERTAHDLNNIITPLLAYPDMLARMLPDESAVNIVKALQESAQRTHQFTQRLSALAGGETEEPKDLDLTKLTGEAVALVQNQIEAVPGIKLECSLQENCMFHMQEAVFLKSFEALLENAIGAVSRVESDGTVSVALEKVRIAEVSSGFHAEMIPAGTYCRLSVMDTGEGIPTEDLSHTVEPFVKGEHKGPGCGGGLGLSIVYCGLRRSGAYLQVESTPKQGTAVSMYFPTEGEQDMATDAKAVETKGATGLASALAGGNKTAQKSSSTSEGETSQPSPADQDTKQRVLVVDDEAPIVDLFKMILENFLSGVVVDVASNGQEAIDRFKENHYRVIVMDLHMPVMDGQSAFFNLQKHCKESEDSMPSIIFCTGYAPQAPLREAVEKEPKHALLNKPVQSEILVNLVKDRLAATA